MKDFKDLTNKDFYFCYRPTKVAYLKRKGFFFITHAISKKTSEEFWLFVKSEELRQALNEYQIEEKF